jgi:hypothetical protein
MLSRKYLANQVLSQAKMGPGCSHFWQSLLSVNEIFQQFSEIDDKWRKNSFLGRQLGE